MVDTAEPEPSFALVLTGVVTARRLARRRPLCVIAAGVFIASMHEITEAALKRWVPFLAFIVRFTTFRMALTTL